MKKAELIKKIVPATIAIWTDNSPEYNHKGKEQQLQKLLWSWNKSHLIKRYEELKRKGYITTE